MNINNEIKKDQEIDALINSTKAYKTYSSVDEMMSILEEEEKNRGIIERIMDFIYYTIWCRGIKDAYYAIKQRLFRKHHLVKTTLSPWQWADTDHRMLYVNMALFEQFLKNEKPFESTDYTYNAYYRDLAKKMKMIDKWWKNYPQRLKDIDIALDVWHDGRNTKNANKYSKKIHKMETDLLNEEQKMLHMLIDIRSGLWT